MSKSVTFTLIEPATAFAPIVFIAERMSAHFKSSSLRRKLLELKTHELLSELGRVCQLKPVHSNPPAADAPIWPASFPTKLAD